MKYYLKVKNASIEIKKDTFNKIKDRVHIYSSRLGYDRITWCCVNKKAHFFELVEEN